jgi:uncharacterized protein (DUF3820 family)
MDKLNDDSLMPFGKYKGEKMANVPAAYLIWLLDNNKCNEPVKFYIQENIEVLKSEMK